MYIYNEDEISRKLGQLKRVCAEINLDNIVYNMNSMHQNINPDTKMIGVIKTDAYGHGCIPIARELEKLDYVFGYAVATCEEAYAIREDGLKKPILILGYTFPYCYDELAKQEIRPAVFRADQLAVMGEAGIKAGKNIKIHIKVDTGMGRIGVKPDEEGLKFVEQAIKTPGVEIEGIFTHFARADEVDKAKAFEQLNKFSNFVDMIDKKLGFKVPYVHCSNSAGILEIREANKDIVRAGITLYGLMPSNEVSCENAPILPVMSVKSHIAHIKTIHEGDSVSYGGTFTANKDTVVATVPVGYGDGYPRGLSNKGYVLIDGKKANILGRVCMDQFMIDITDFENVKPGDEVVLIGKSGDAFLSMEEVGDISGRFNYELACLWTDRVPRVYMKNGKCVAIKCQ